MPDKLYRIPKLKWIRDSSGWKGEQAITTLLCYTVLNEEGTGKIFTRENGTVIGVSKPDYHEKDHYAAGKKIAEKAYMAAMRSMLKEAPDA